MYVLDADSFIAPKRTYYAFDLCPGYWDTLLRLQGDGLICSIDEIYGDLMEYEDELKEWAMNTMPDTCFCNSKIAEVVESYAQIQRWAVGQDRYTQAARDEFASVSDAWLIAYAHAKSATGEEHIIVTHETYDDKIRKKIKIPNACEPFGVQCVNVFEMLQRYADEVR